MYLLKTVAVMEPNRLGIWFWGSWYLKSLSQYFSYILAVSFIGGETGGPGENQRPVARH
jgi:hypothetical protein